ncbi:MAG: hypothetical protein IJL97_03010, partial [Lachnospiraceae bacterium]|nr:hypothetical protein [Lachnospiraceae bacterium]
VENTGNLVLKNIEVADELTGDSWTIDVLKPGESITLTGKIKHTVTVGDVSRGYVEKKVTGKATADDGNQTEVSAESNTIRSATWTPGKPAKTGDDFDPKLWIGLMVGAAAVVAIVIIILLFRRRKREE